MLRLSSVSLLGALQELQDAHTACCICSVAALHACTHCVCGGDVFLLTVDMETNACVCYYLEKGGLRWWRRGRTRPHRRTVHLLMQFKCGGVHGGLQGGVTLLQLGVACLQKSELLLQLGNGVAQGCLLE